jgi:RimJ/RimL family protein N-acetyltransferase
VLLRPWREADVPDNLMAFNDLSFQRFSWPQAAPFTEDDARGYFADQESARLRGLEVQLVIVEREQEEAVLGSASLYALNLEQRSAAVGYWLAPPGSRPRGRVDRGPAACHVGVHDVGVGSDRADVWTG